jgi:hypothetical protein
VLHKSGCRTLITRPDDLHTEPKEFVAQLNDAGAKATIQYDHNRTFIAISVAPRVPLATIAGILGDWEWDAAWSYLDPKLDANMARRLDLPVPTARPFPPEPGDWPDWAENLVFVGFRPAEGNTEQPRRAFDTVAELLDRDRVRIVFPDPQQPGVSMGDIYKIEPSETSWPEAERLIEKSGNRRIWLDVAGSRRKSDPLFCALTQLGCALTARTGTYSETEVSISIPPKVSIAKAVEILRTARAGGRRLQWRITDPWCA